MMRPSALKPQNLTSRLVSQRRWTSTVTSESNDINFLEVNKIKIFRVGRTLPHRDFKVNTYSNCVPLEKVPVSFPRMEQHYYNTMVEDLMLLTYDHQSPDADLNDPSLNVTKELPPHHLRTLFSTPLEELPTDPSGKLGACTNLITKSLGTEVKMHKRVFKKGNPIDFVGMKSKELNQRQEQKAAVPYKPVHEFLPALKKIELRIVDHAAIQNKLRHLLNHLKYSKNIAFPLTFITTFRSILYSAIMSLSQITGAHASPLYAERGDAVIRLREGAPIGALAELKGQRMYEFLDKLVHTVLPRLRDWDGLVPTRNEQGFVVLKLRPSEMGYFPDIEPHFDMYPMLFETEIGFITNCKNINEDALLLSGFGIPIDGSTLFKAEADVVEEVDIYAKYKKEVEVVKKDLGRIRGTLKKLKMKK